MKFSDKVNSPEGKIASIMPKVKARRSSSIGLIAPQHEDGTYKSKPIAELYPETTIMVRHRFLRDKYYETSLKIISLHSQLFSLSWRI